MAKFTGASQTFTIGGNAITCIQSGETDERIDIYEVACAAATDKEKVSGLKSSRMSLSFAVETDDVTVLGYVDPGDSGAIVYRPAGATSGDINIAATTGIVASRRISAPVEGIVVVSIEIELSNLAISAIA